MEIGKIPVALPALTKINDELNKMVKTLATNQIRNVLSDISDKYGIAKNELFARYLSADLSIELAKDTNTDGSTEQQKGKRVRKAIADEDRCLAKISNGTRCSRRRKDENLYCGSHMTARPFGEFAPDDATESPTTEQDADTDCDATTNTVTIADADADTNTNTDIPKKTKIFLSKKQ